MITFEDFRPISYFNLIHKLITKIIENRLKPILSEIISEEQYGFIYKRQIHDVVVITQKAMHSMKAQKLASIVMNLDLSKDYDKVKWSFVKVTLIQFGMKLKMITWIMGCLESSSFVVLINGYSLAILWPSRGIRQGFPLSPFIFLIVSMVLIMLVKNA